MNILLIGHRNWLAQWTEGCEKALRHLGHHVETFYYIDFGSPAGILTRVTQGISRRFPGAPVGRKRRMASVNRRLLQAAVDFRPDLVLILKGERILPETLQGIKEKTGAVIAVWWADDPFVHWDTAHPSLHLNTIRGLPLFDHFFVFDSYHIPKLRQFGARNSHLLPLAFDPDIYRPVDLTSEDREKYGSDMAFLGTYRPSREEVLTHISQGDLRIWGGGNYPRLNGKATVMGLVTPHEAAKIYSASKMVININHQQSIHGGNTKVFETCACGALQVTEAKMDIVKAFEPGREIVCYRAPEELREIVSYYLNHEDARQEIAHRGRARACAEHTYTHRMAEFLDIASR